MPCYFFKANENVNTNVYYKVLRYYIFPCLKRTFPRDNYVFTQNGTPVHTCKKVWHFCSCFLDVRILAFVLTRREPPELCCLVHLGGQDEQDFAPKFRCPQGRDHR
uniref:Uncharacterized protein n=1 Tax=Lepeophtheirus salmonis TaxID=72036 RepID=A0A0K2VB28_LEPSM